MRGHESILKMRERKFTPSIVFINDYQCDTDWEEFGDHPTICTHGDSLSSLDMRFLVGCAVSISSDSEKRAKALFEACKRAGCTTVAATHNIPVNDNRVVSGWTEVFHA